MPSPSHTSHTAGLLLVCITPAGLGKGIGGLE
jgi:hypothetical protein